MVLLITDRIEHEHEGGHGLVIGRSLLRNKCKKDKIDKEIFFERSILYMMVKMNSHKVFSNSKRK